MARGFLFLFSRPFSPLIRFAAIQYTVLYARVILSTRGKTRKRQEALRLELELELELRRQRAGHGAGSDEISNQQHSSCRRRRFRRHGRDSTDLIEILGEGSLRFTKEIKKVTSRR